MSNIYIQEPPTHGKVLLETSVGDIDVELWSKEAPKACRNFVQLCIEGYYDGTIFHRVVKDFIVQGGDPSGTGLGGESVYGRPFRDEFHTRLRFVRRGLLAMANAGRDDNASQFFFTLAPCPELQNKHTIFGKVAGNTIYNMLKLEDGLVKGDDRPLYPHKINAAKVLYNPFDDIIPRTIKSKSVVAVEAKSTKAAKKNFKLLSFGDEAEEDEEEANVVAQGFRGKSKSSHDLTNDPHLSSLPALPPEEPQLNDVKPKDRVESQLEEAERNHKVDEVRKKLKRESTDLREGVKRSKLDSEKNSEDGDSQVEPQKNNLQDIRKEVRKLKQEIQRDRIKNKEEKEASQEIMTSDQDAADVDVQGEASAADEDASDYAKSTRDFKKKDKKKDAKGNHEDQTLVMLEKFKAKLQSARSDSGTSVTTAVASDDVAQEEDDESDVGWLTHTLNFESREALTKDANMSNEDTFEIYDPRNPINQRRREASKVVMKEKNSGSRTRTVGSLV